MKVWEVMSTNSNFFDPLFIFIMKINDHEIIFEIPGEVWDKITVEEDKIRWLKKLFTDVHYERPITEDFLNMRISMSEKIPIVYLILRNPINKQISDNSQKSLNE
jgi:hypothetical protein